MSKIDKYLASDMKERKKKVWSEMKDISSNAKGIAMWSKRFDVDGNVEDFKQKLGLDIRQMKMNLNRIESLYILR